LSYRGSFQAPKCWNDLEKNVGKAVHKAVNEAVSQVIENHLKDVD
jgi:hypothetical protein